MENKNIEIIIDELLEKVLDLYPQERVNKIKERSNDLWNGKPSKDRIVYIYSGTFPSRDMPILPENITQNQKDLAEQLQAIINHSDWDDDFFPALSPGIKQITIPSYFGCIEEVASASTKVKSIINQPSDVYNLTEVGFVQGTEGYEMLEKMRYYRQRTKGLLPIYETDMQGPFSVASQIWGVEEFLIAIYDCPDEVNYLIQKCTDTIIKYFNLMLEAVEGDLIPMHCFPLMWFPKEKGVAVSEDLAAVVSPTMIREFVRPYLEQIAEKFGGVVMHSCGSINHIVKELNQVKGMVGINCSSTETDIEMMSEDLNPNYVLITHHSPVNRTDLPLYNQTQHIELCKKIFGKGRINGICIVNPWNAIPEPSKDAQTYRDAATY